ncbi:glycosyltransferase family 2 protein [Latilactobacillus graminis]|uniref:Glycosyltransferase family 2 protein n=1 Tax=Latilactobacillus graminis TaxID=60519 RepID=A0ABX6C8N1_9LACO|nr:glycosyltransferase family 2 protein [Latilactobacillus graminis]
MGINIYRNNEGRFEVKPNVSVIIPVYNGEKTVERAIRSCLNQTYQSLEVLAIDNGSVDQSVQIIENLCKADKRVKLVKLTKKGRSNARNVGLDQANGEFIQFLDADDELLPHKIKTAVNFLESHADCFAYGTGIEYMTNKGSIKRIPDTSNDIELMIHNIFPINTLIFRKNPIRFDRTIDFDEDWLYWVDLFKNNMSGVTMTSEIGARVHVTGENTMNDTSRMLYYEILIRGIIRQKYPISSGMLLKTDVKKMLMLNSLVHLGKITNNQYDEATKYFMRLNKVAKVLFMIPIVRQKTDQGVNGILEKQTYQG